MPEDSHGAEADDKESAPGWAGSDTTAAVATAGVIVVGAALIEAALIPGMIVGAAAVLAPKYLPKAAAGMQPLFRSVVRGAYKMGRKAREAAAEAREHMHDIVAEVHAEDTTTPAETAVSTKT